MKTDENRAPTPIPEPLTRREREVLALLAQGLSGPEIAQQLTLGLSSVKSHIQHLYGKLGVNGKRLAVARAKELGLLGAVTAAPTVSLLLPSAAPRVKHNLPRQVTRFFGREREIAQVVELIGEHPLVTLTGSGGVGKTRLSLAVAEAVLHDFADGVWLVELAALSDPALVPQQVAASLGVRDDPGRPILETLTGYLRQREALLVLDNCEHLLDACSRLSDALLRACPNVRILASSREPQAAYGESVFRVPSLSFPDSHTVFSPDQIDQYAAVSLFIDRARLVQPAYVLEPRNSGAVTRICQRLDGIPLAIEMAAARINLLSANQLADRLDDAFRLLTVGSRSALPRQQTLRATIDWSYQLLTEPERLLLRRLSVFAGGCTLEAAEAVCSGDGLEPSQVLDVLGSLVAKSMVIASRGAGEEARYHLQETIRQYGWEKVREAGEAEAIQRRHLDYFLVLGAEAEPNLTGPTQLAWLNRLEAELDNIRAAVEHSRSDHEIEARWVMTVVSLFHFWNARYHGREAYDWVVGGLERQILPQGSLEWGRALHFVAFMAYSPATFARQPIYARQSVDALRAAGLPGRHPLAYALITLGDIEHSQGNFAAKAVAVEESLGIFREVGDKWGQALALHRLANTLDPLVNYQANGQIGARAVLPALAPSARNDHSAERALFEESLGLLIEIGDRRGQTMDLVDLAFVAINSGDLVAGRRLLEECLAISREFGNTGSMGANLLHLGTEALAEDDLGRAVEHFDEALAFGRDYDNQGFLTWLNARLAEVARRQGDYPRATALLADILAARQKEGDREMIAATLDGQGRMALSQGDYSTATVLQTEALITRLEAGHPICLACSFHALAVLAVAQKQAERAALLFGAAQPYHPALYIFWSLAPIWRAEHERSVEAVRAQLGEPEMARLWAEGEAMTLEQAVDCALGDKTE